MLLKRSGTNSDGMANRMTENCRHRIYSLSIHLPTLRSAKLPEMGQALCRFLAAVRLAREAARDFHFLGVRFPVQPADENAAETMAISAAFLAVYPVSQIRLCSPHSHIPSKIGIKDFPRSVKLYSTLGGI